MLRAQAAVIALLATALVGAPAGADDRGDAKAQVAFGIRVARSGLWREALYRFNRAVEIDATYAAAWNNLAIAYEQTGEVEKARQAYEKALSLAPKNHYIQDNYELFKEIRGRSERPKAP